MVFVAVFMTTKVAELWFYSNDDTIPGQLSILGFMCKFVPSFFAYADGYTDATSITIARSCDDPLAQIISQGMLCSYVLGVVLFQWVVLGCWAQSDKSHACLMKLVHMDALASCVTIPPESRTPWIAVSVARTLGEDIPQAVLQSLFILYVKKNAFMMLSVFVSVCTSVKAIYDATSRALKASGANSKAKQQKRNLRLLRAAGTGDKKALKLVRKLLRDGADPHYARAEVTPLMMAIAAGDDTVADALRQAGAQELVMTPETDDMGEAFRTGNISDVVRHIASGADVNMRLTSGEGIIASAEGRPLHAACALVNTEGAYEVALLLLRRKADVSAGDAEGDTPLSHARYHKAEELYGLLEGNGARIGGRYYSTGENRNATASPPANLSDSSYSSDSDDDDDDDDDDDTSKEDEEEEEQENDDDDDTSKEKTGSDSDSRAS